MAESALLTPGLDRALRLATLALTLVFSCAFGLVTPYLAVALAIVVALAVLFRGRLPEAYAELPAQLFLACFVALGAIFAVSADYLSAFNFAMLVLYGPLVLLLSSGRSVGNGVRFAQLATAGAVVALAAAAITRYGFGIPRAEMPNFGAILLANTAILLGFLGLTGIMAPGAKWRWLYLLAPLVGMAAALITDSRGPLLALPPLALVAIVGLAATARRRPLLVLLAGFAFVGVAAAAAMVLVGDRVASLVTTFIDLANGDAVSLDNSTLIRLNFYAAAIGAFAEAPVFGHGWANMTTVVVPHLRTGYQGYGLTLPQLHNDLVDFAVAGGLAGVAVYLLLLVTPILAALRSVRDSLRPVRLFAVTVLVVAYAADGLTDLMFGFEFHTWLYLALSAVILGWVREPAPRRGPACDPEAG